MSGSEFVHQAYAELLDALFDDEDLRIDTMRRGDGTPDPAVRVTHLATGHRVVVDERPSQKENATLALIRIAAALRNE